MKRRAARVILFLLLGAILNIAVAWGFAAFAPFWHFESSSRDLHDSESLIWSHRLDVGESDAMWSADYAALGFRLFIVRTLSALEKEGREVRCGWPLLSLQCVVTDERAEGIAIEPPYYTQAQDEISFLFWPRRLPTRPLWPGFAINTIFYAAILWLPVAGLGALRRRRRIKRGLCPACAYPVGTNPHCTECGKPVNVKMGSTA